jgi:hypothetical protein
LGNPEPHGNYPTGWVNRITRPPRGNSGGQYRASGASDSARVIERAKAQFSTLDVAGRYVQLRKNGAERSGPCPLCKEGNDRFYVRVDGSWGCRKCEKRGGDSVALYAAIEGLGQGEAARRMLGEDRGNPGKTPVVGPLVPLVPAAPAAAKPSMTPEEFHEKSRSPVRRAFKTLTRGSVGGKYLLSRGIEAETWGPWFLGEHAHKGRPALVIPWVTQARRIEAVKYRYLDESKPKYGQSAGGRSILYGAHMLAENGHGRTLVIVEGEINALSLWQASRAEPWDVVSVGSKSISTAVIEQLTEVRGRGYESVVVWMDEADDARKVANAIGGIPMQSPADEIVGDLDANDILRTWDPRVLVALVQAQVMPEALPIDHLGARILGKH